MKLIFLGTSGSIPTVQRGISAIALRRDGEIFLFDCAEGTQRQMAIAHLSPMKVSSVFITHLHGDHFLGLAGLVQTLSLMLRDNPLEVFCPRGEGNLVESYLRIPHYTLTFEVKVHELDHGAEVRRKGYRILTSAVDHSVPALAYAFVEDDRAGRLDPEKAAALGVIAGSDFSKLKSGQSVESRNGSIISSEQVVGPSRPGRRIVYTGDTRPSERIVELAHGVDLLIHDCTLADELSDKASENYHSTPSKAAKIAKKAGVKKLVLTHISPRYEDDTVLLQEARKVFPNTVVAQDLMVIDVPLQK